MPRKLEVNEFNKTSENCPWCGADVVWEESVFTFVDGKKRDPYMACVTRPKCKWTSAKKNRTRPDGLVGKSDDSTIATRPKEGES